MVKRLWTAAPSAIPAPGMTYSGVMRDAASDVEVLEELWGASILPRDLLPDLGCHGPGTRQGQSYL